MFSCSDTYLSLILLGFTTQMMGTVETSRLLGYVRDFSDLKRILGNSMNYNIKVKMFSWQLKTNEL